MDYLDIKDVIIMNANDKDIKTTDEETKTSGEETNTPEEENALEEEIDSSDDIVPLSDIGEEFAEDIKFPKEAPATSEEELRLRMKKRILASYRWQEDIIIPFSKELKITPEELEEIMIRRLDMSSLEAIHPRFESAKLRCIKERVHSDLRLCVLVDVMNLLTEEESENIKTRTAIKIIKDEESYEKFLDEGRKELVEHLKR